MSLNDNIHQLTRPHLKTGPDGTLHQVPALLAELRIAVTPGHAGSAGGKDGGQPIPINPNALDLIGAIERESRADYADAIGAPWAGTLETLMQNYLSANISAEWAAYLERVTLEWVTTITAMLWPTRPRRKLTGKECPSCGQTYHGDDREVCLTVGCWGDDGEMASPGEWDIKCEGCGAEWRDDEVKWLLAAFATPKIRAPTRHPENLIRLVTPRD